MTDYAKKIVELQRRVQQAFLTVEEFHNPRTLLSRKRAGNTAEFQLGRAIESLAFEIAEIKDADINSDHMDIIATELALLEQSSARLNAIWTLMNVTKTLRRMVSKEEASLLCKKAEEDFDLMREAHPFIKEDIESRVAHIVFCQFIGEVSLVQPVSPHQFPTNAPLKKIVQRANKIDRQCADAEADVIRYIDAPNPSLHATGEIEQHDVFSTEKCMNELASAQQKGGDLDRKIGPHEWLASLKLEKCKVSYRARKVLTRLVDLINLASKQPTNHSIPRSISVIIQLFIERARPTIHSGADAAVYFNDCLYLAVEIGRAKCKSVTDVPTDAFNFSNLITTMRKAGRNTLMRDLAHVKSTFLSWSDSALADYLSAKNNEFATALSHLKRFDRLWKDVCSKNTYAWLMLLVCSHMLDRLLETMLKLEKFDRATCSRVLPLVNEFVEVCSTLIRTCETDLKKKFVDMKPGQSLVKKAAQLKETMIAAGADQSLAELFNFRIDA